MASHQDGASVGAEDHAPDRRNGGWTDDRVARLKVLFAEGLPPREIARRLGGVSKNAVIGKCNRMGLNASDNAPAHIKAKRGPAPRVPAAKPVRLVLNTSQKASPGQNHAWRAGPSTEAKPLPKMGPEDLPGMRPAQLRDLNSRQCRWPLSLTPDIPGRMDETLFCGAPAPGLGQDEPPYCPAHTQMAHPKGGQQARENVDRRLGIAPGRASYDFDDRRAPCFGGR
jgi:GcrA cell cycle regulator